MRRHHGLPARVSLVLVALLGAACTAPARPDPAPGSPASTAPSTVAPIAWLDAPTPAPSAAGPSTLVTTRPCSAGDLPATATYAQTGGISQSESDLIQLRNAGTSPCTLGAGPDLLYTDQHGQVRPLPTDHAGIASGGGSAGPATIAPGETAALLVVFSHGCGAGQLSYQGIMLVQAGKRIPVPRLRLTGTCPTVHIGSWQPPQQSTPVPPSLHQGTLAALIDAPATVRAGAVLDYQVTLANPDAAAVPLDPCPVYQESIYKLSATYLLNCPSGGIPPGSSTRFAMRITVPTSVPPGHYRLAWAIVEAGGESATASAPIDITQPA
jgi:Protein of unknown function (DUF4232)